jgi:hypothetical protein
LVVTYDDDDDVDNDIDDEDGDGITMASFLLVHPNDVR